MKRALILLIPPVMLSIAALFLSALPLYGGPTDSAELSQILL